MKHAISAGHQSTLETGKEVLKSGGNAFDAAIAAFFTMCISEPCMASAGANGFAMLKPKNQHIKYFDFFSQTPKHKNVLSPDFYPVIVDFGDETEEFHIGLGSAAVPGSIAGMLDMHKKYGSIPLTELIQPASELAKQGIALDGFQAYDIYLLQEILAQHSSGREIFFNKNGIKKEGDIIKMPQLPDFLEFITTEGKRGFYEGEIAQSIVRDSKERGGFLTMEDFKDYSVNIVEPFKFPFKNKLIFAPNGPNNGGLSLALFLGMTIFSDLDIPNAIRQTQSLLKDPKSAKEWLNKMYPANNYELIKGDPAHRGTSHLSILDKNNNAVSLSFSIGEGCGYFIKGTDMQLNNMLGELYLLPGGAHSWETGIRLQSMMTPTLVSDKSGKIEFLAGSGGAGRIPFAIGQVIRHHLGNKPLRDSVEAPRYHYQNGKFQVELGAEWPLDPKKALLWDKKSLYFGGVHAISRINGHIEAVGDARRWGVADVFE